MSKRTAGTGTITYRNGRYEAKVSKYDPNTGETVYNKNGYPVRISRSFKTKHEAEAFIAEYNAARNKHLPFISADIPFKEWADTWFTVYKTSGVKPYTIDTAETVLRIHLKPALGNIKLSQLTPVRIQMFYSSLIDAGKSAKTIKNIHTFLNQCLALAVDQGLLISNPCNSVKLPKVKKYQAKPLNKADLIALVKETAQFRDAYDFLTFFTVFTGLRLGEVEGLTWDKIDLDKGTITVDQQLIRTKKHKGGVYHLAPTKTCNTRTFILAPSVMDALKQYKLEQDFKRSLVGDAWENSWNLVFTLDSGRWLSAPTVHKHFKRIASAIGRPDLRFHDLRHSFASFEAEAGVPLAALAKTLGHSNTSVTTQYYIHATSEMDNFCANLTESLIKSVS